MICPECQTDNIEGVDHCENCGHDLRGLDQPDAPGARTGVEFMYQRLSELPAKTPSRVQVDDPVGFSVRLMQSEETDCALVMNGDDLAGIITPWDILHKVAGPDEDLNAVTCGQVMTADPVFLRDEDTIAVALNKMSIGGFRHIPLLQDGRPKAVVNIEDVFSYISPYLS